MKKRLSAIILALVMLLVACGGAGGNNKNTSNTGNNKEENNATASAETTEGSVEGSLTAAGSSALLPLVEDAAKSFQEKNDKVSISVSGGGSGAGLKQVSEGAIDIGNSDVAAAEKLDEAQAKELVDHKVCVITMAPVVNKAVAEKVDNLTKDQMIGVFTGKIKNWKEVGGPDEEIVPISRPSTSGTRALFEQYALDGQKQIDGSLETDDSGTLLQTVADTPGAIGYLALSYLQEENENVKVVKLDGVEPSLENTYNGKYPVWGYEHMYTKGQPNEVAKAFLDYIMGDEYGKKVEEMGYGVTSKMTVER